MNSIALILSFLTFALSEILIQPRDQKCCGSVDVDSYPDANVNFTNDTVLEVNEGWQPFYFGDAGTWALASNSSGAFYTAYKFPVIIRIIDAYNTGDRFSLYLNGSWLGNTTNPINGSEMYTQYPNEAWVLADYTRGEWLIPAGLHRFTIKTLNSVDPAGSGAFIRADVNPAIECGKCRKFCSDGSCKCFPVVDPKNPPGCCPNNPPRLFPICKEATGNFYLIKGKFTRDQAISACTTMNLRLAEITSGNFDGVNQFGYVCNGNQVAQSWIRSWNGDFYENACLVLSSGSFSGTGAINAQPCETKNYALCQT